MWFVDYETNLHLLNPRFLVVPKKGISPFSFFLFLSFLLAFFAVLFFQAGFLIFS